MIQLEQGLGIGVKTDKSDYRLDKPIKMVLIITNNSRQPIEVPFATAKKYDFIVMQGESVAWRWSSNKLFAIIRSTLRLKPRGSCVFKEVLKAGNLLPGSYTLIGSLASAPPLTATCRFRVHLK